MDVDDDDIRYELLRTLQVKHALLLLLILLLCRNQKCSRLLNYLFITAVNNNIV